MNRHLVIAAASALAIACSSSSSGDEGGSSGNENGRVTSCASPTLPSKAELAAGPAARFTADVAPIFARSCSFASCHAAGTKRLVLSGASAYANLMAAQSTEASMKMVAPGDPDQSFLMHKLDGTQCALDCGEAGCGTSMPKNGDLLPEDARDSIRRWIAQGAKNE